MESIRPLVSRKAKKRSFWRRSWPWLLLVVFVTGSAGWYFLLGPGSSKARIAAASQGASVLLTARVQRGNIEVSATGSGTLKAGQEVDLSFSTSGTVSELNVKIGDMVEKGQVLARLESAENLQADLAAAQLNLLVAQQSLKKLQVNAGVSLAQAYQDWVTAQKTYSDALMALQRTEYARCSQAVTTRYAQALEKAKDRLANIKAEYPGSQAWIDAKNDLDTAQANYNYCIAHTDEEKISAQSRLEVAKSALDQAEQKYITLKGASGIDPDELTLAEAKVKEAEAQVTLAQDNLDGTVLDAPFAGKVIYIASQAGTMVDTSTYITLADISSPNLTVSVSEEDIDKLAVGNKAMIVFDALPDQTLSGTVVEVSPALVSSGFYSVVQGVVKLDEASIKTVENLPLGVTATVTIISREADNVLLVPLTAIKRKGNQEYYVMKVGSDGSETQQMVTIGLENSSYAEILTGLSEGDLVNSGVSALSSNNNSQFPAGLMPGEIPGGGMPAGGPP